ncbi:hypothetical protein VZH09_02865 [Synechococcus elongatus IITB7]|uniref:hypothetical protein n=1 Tax=Synechococcus elongatus TaxID=32046 RepID=UPI0030CECC29
MSALLLYPVLLDLVRGTIAALAIALVGGGLIGAIAGAVNRRWRRTLAGSLLGSFWGVLLLAILPISVIPGLIGGGPYAGVYVLLFAVILLPLGLAVGATLGILIFLRCSPPQIRRWLTWVVIVGYGVMTIALTLSWARYCSRNYCEFLGSPNVGQTPMIVSLASAIAPPAHFHP